MKTYKRSIWSSVTIWACFIPVLISVCIIPLIILYVPGKSSLSLIPFIPLIILLAASASAFFYIELTENELILKNAVCRFWHKAYPYQTITRIKLKNSGGLTQTRLQIINGQKKLGCYVIDLVSPDDYKMLIEDLQRKGIVVEVSHNITI